MDDKVVAAVGAVGLADSEQEKWFETICETYERAVGAGTASDWSSLASVLESDLRSAHLARDAIEQFVEHFKDDSYALETVRGMAEAGPRELLSTYRELLAQNVDEDTGTEEAPEDEAYDPQAWDRFLAENGPRWNGTTEAWEPFTTWFLYEAGQHGLTGPASGFLAYVSGEADKVAVFGRYGVRIAAPVAATTAATTEQSASVLDMSSFPELKVGASGEWVGYLDQALKSKGF